MESRIFFAVVDDHAGIRLPQKNLACETFVFQTEDLSDVGQGVSLQIQFIEAAHGLRVGVGDEDSSAAVVVVAEGDAAAARPEAGTDPFFHSHAGTHEDIFPFQLGESGENADHRFSVGTSGIQPLVDRHEIDTVGNEYVFDEVESIFLAPAQTVQFIYDNRGYETGGSIVDEIFQRGALNIAAAGAGVDVGPYQ